MKTLKNIIIGSAIIFALIYTLNLEYFLKGIRVVYFNGQTTVFIDDLKYFDHEVIESTPEKSPWPVSENLIDKPLIFNNGLPGNLVADNLDGIITNVFIGFFINHHNINRGKIVH